MFLISLSITFKILKVLRQKKSEKGRFFLEWENGAAGPYTAEPRSTDTRFIRTVSFVPTNSSYFFVKINPLYSDTR